MVSGLDKFKDYFSKYTDQYVLIGGAACDVIMGDFNSSFRATKDLDLVLIVEALTPEFGRVFWKFIQDGKYRNKSMSVMQPQFYKNDVARLATILNDNDTVTLPEEVKNDMKEFIEYFESSRYEITKNQRCF